MDTVTYPDGRTVAFVTHNVIPVRVSTASPPHWASRYPISATPTVLVLDEDGREFHRIVGFLPPEEFIPSVMLGCAKVFVSRQRTAKAKSMLDTLLALHPYSRISEEAKRMRNSLR